MRPAKGEKRKERCPQCGNPTEQILECPVCNRDGCTERCIAGGKGVPCNECDQKGEGEEEEGEGPVARGGN